jgi:hypothetical protein
MGSIAGKSGGASVFNISPERLDIYIKECMHCAHTCRTCADGCAGNPNRFSEIIDVCLQCAKTCESLAKGLSLHKQGVKNIRQVQIEAAIVSSRLCANRCEQRAKEFDCIEVCAKSVRRCEEIITTLLQKPSRPKGAKIFTFLKSFTIK